jgi:hypothetical protein
MIVTLSTLLLISHVAFIPPAGTSELLFARSSRTFPTPIVDTPKIDSSITNDTLEFDLKNGLVRKHHRTHIFSISEISNNRQVPYLENFSMIDFNRVTGFFLGLGTPGQVDLGPHDELGVDGSFGYGFASKRWEYRLGGEFRLPLADVKKIEEDTSFKHHFYSPPTLAVGAGFHNITSTDDVWRESRLENALDAFFAREDFRDYYKLAGWDAYLAFRPILNTELRFDWRSDHYDSLQQDVFYGRFGGNKVLPPNPAVAQGQMNSLAITGQNEHVHTRYLTVTNIFGDSVEIQQLKGRSNLFQIELGHMPGSDFGFNRYLLDSREFNPILHGLSIDTRLRFEATTGDMLPQKMEFLGGPGSLPAFYQNSIGGNRMLLLNTEVRFNLNIFSVFFHSPDLNLIIYNDFAKMGIAGDGESILQGFQFSGASSILYNYGIGLGWTNGIQIGASWRTDIKTDPRVMFRLERPF